MYDKSNLDSHKIALKLMKLVIREAKCCPGYLNTINRSLANGSMVNGGFTSSSLIGFVYIIPLTLFLGTMLYM